MTLEKEEELRSNGNLFQEPDSTPFWWFGTALARCPWYLP